MSTSDKLQVARWSKTSTLTGRRLLQVPDEGGRREILVVGAGANSVALGTSVVDSA
jgi:uncharacterized protein